ncbi:MAG: Cys-tRNA(Pro) deacylase [Colwellia sp.]|nr:Cys-tRNA(Pro) deacylase [Colwellia sp.]
MTPAINQAKKHKVNFKIHQYQHDAHSSSFGLEAVEKLSLKAERVFKTLIVETESKTLIVAVIPVTHQLNLKALAKTISVKKVKMADAKRVESTTGYVLGGVSPLGQKKSLTTFIDSSSQSHHTIFVSGGKRGLELELSPQDLVLLTKAKFANIIDKH